MLLGLKKNCPVEKNKNTMMTSLIVSSFKTPIGSFEVCHNERYVYRAHFMTEPGCSGDQNKFNQSISPGDSPSSPIHIACLASSKVNLEHCCSPPLPLPGAIESGQTITLKELIQKELQNYFLNPAHRFQLPLAPHGTLFQQRVWNALLVVPSGRTMTYGELANTLQTSPRAIGQACKQNAVTLLIPCHRVIGQAGVGGYMGDPKGLPFKLRLLAHEGVDINRFQVS